MKQSFLQVTVLAMALASCAEDSPYPSFTVPEGFVAEHYALDKHTSSVLSIAFNSKGQLLTATAGSGPSEIRILDETNGICSGHRVFYAGLHCQGLCAIGTDVYVVANGKFYRLQDVGGRAENQEILCPDLLGAMSEHGPHAAVLGPDGYFYIMLGNDCSFKLSHLTAASPVREENLYWGNLLPLQNSGFLDGRGPPGGCILRTDVKGKSWELIAHGFRNAYDLAFSPSGEIFSADADMEWDIGLPWYRPCRIVHVPFGANFGWRYGSGKWKNHCADSTPPMTETGRGSPAGVEVYNHAAFPEEYRDAIFVCDWARARVLVTKPVRKGATWTGESSEFLTAKDANFPVTDCCTGPDGALYFSYGGRGAKGGVARVRYTGGKAMKAVFRAVELHHLSEPIARALNTPQYQSAFGRAAIAAQKKIAGADWNKQLSAIARDGERDEGVRGRALDFLGMDGNRIDPSLLIDLSKDKSSFMRAQAALRISLNGDASARGVLPTLLGDSDSWVLRRACETLQRHPDPEAADKLVALLGHSDRFVRFAASSALLRLPADTWSAKAVALPSALGKAEGLLTWAQSFLSLNTDPQNVAPHFEKMLSIGADLLEEKPGDEETLLALRAVGLTLLARAERHKADAASTTLAPSFAPRTAIPTLLKNRLILRAAALLEDDDERACMDAAEVLGFVADSRSIAPLLEKIKNDLLPRDERIHYANCVCNIADGWTSSSAGELLEFLAAPGPGENGRSFGANLIQCAARMGRQLTSQQRAASFNALSTAAKTFTATVPGFNELSLKTLVETVVKANDMETRKQVLGKIAEAGNDEAFRELEKLLDPTSPLFDSILTLLMRFKHADAKKYAVAGLTSSSRGVAADALMRVKELYKQNPDDQNLYYGLIVSAARVSDTRAEILELLKRWPMDANSAKGLPKSEHEQIAFWESAYKRRYADDKRAFPVFAGEGLQEPAKFQRLVDYVRKNPPERNGNAEAGKILFKTTAKCLNCHAFKGEGQQLGPELTDVVRRFESAKILEDIVYPSKIVDTRYKQALFTMKDGQRISGFVSAESDETLSITNGDALTMIVKKADIARRGITELSIMPAGLLDGFTMEQIRDLLAFLETGKK